MEHFARDTFLIDNITIDPYNSAQLRQSFLQEEHYNNMLATFEYDYSLIREPDESENALDRYHSYSYLLFQFGLLKYSAGGNIASLDLILDKIHALFARGIDWNARFEDEDARWYGLYSYYPYDEESDRTYNTLGLCILFNKPEFVKLIRQYAPDKQGDTDQAFDALTKLLLPEVEITSKAVERPHTVRKHLLAAIMADKEQDVIKHLNKYLASWYQGMKTMSWIKYDSHLEQRVWGRVYGYHGYWSFEAAAVAFVKNIDDSSLHQYIYYPKDIVAYARSQFPHGLTKVPTMENLPRSQPEKEVITMNSNPTEPTKYHSIYNGSHLVISSEHEKQLLAFQDPAQAVDFVRNELFSYYEDEIEFDYCSRYQWHKFEAIIKRVSQSADLPNGIDNMFLEGDRWIEANNCVISYKSPDTVKKIADLLADMNHDEFETAFDDAVFNEEIEDLSEDDIYFSSELSRFFGEAADRSLCVLFIVESSGT